ncbi:DDE-type integrase/transposase/recombinase [Streptomyces sp. AV19]|uniref:Mu transposase C-terminal domain-containing protein n=1 Tax=Streptomyces sp. AV19 TaxID=2793068 RepID=UPI0018FE9022|nr:Mu transposase C-terminal domain-containing protein [Streptomyces sp. AV19]MBH1935814.1 DDE-type integrase/transposase/recombinase [Streptomyces sp. AV19]MDG4534043.1 Mu transposase C-terminal domain-containing protein [Streptomyces sp. AV19]
MEDGDAVRAGGGLPAASRTALRGPAVRRLLALRAGKKLTAGHVRVAADALGVSERTVWRWLAAAQSDEIAAASPGARSRADARFTITPEVRGLLALWKGNVRAVHRELVVRAARQSPPADAPSLTTLHRAIRRDLTPGERAGLAGGERAARKHDVFLTRPWGWRNQAWETDHMQVPVLVDVDGRARRPWITWFTDCATNAITGVAVTPVHPSRESVLAALRSAVLREEPYGPFGGLPEKVRVDRGKDFLSRTVTAAFDLLDVTVEDLPAYTPHLKGTVEGLNRAVEPMLLAALPGYARQPRPGKRPSRPKDEVLLSFEDFTARLLDWTRWWNTEHRPEPLRGRTPLQAWQDDPTPLRDVPAADLWTFTLEDAGTRTLTTRGVRFRRRDYVGAWMTGQAGIRVRVRFMPHHDHRIEVYHATTGRYLGPADLADQATEEQVSAVRRARAARSRRLKKDLEASQRERYAAVTQAEPPQRLGALTGAQAAAELAQSAGTGLSQLALPDVIPPAAPPADWRTPASLAALTTPSRPAPPPSSRDSTATAPDSPDRRAARPTTDEDGDAS